MNDIDKYLHKLYKFSFSKKFKIARGIVKKSPNIVVRPMLLSHIGDFLSYNKRYEYSFQIYETLIECWVDRESNKAAILSKYGSTDVYKNILYTFSEKLAFNLYHNRKNRGGYYITREECSSIEGGDEIQKMTDSEKRSKSLLNRTANGQLKFSHKSILEYFLARQIFSNCNLYKSFDFDGMDAVNTFLTEMFIFQLKKLPGKYGYVEKIGEKVKNFNEITVLDFQNIIEVELNDTLPSNSLMFDFFRNLKVFVQISNSDLLNELLLIKLVEDWTFNTNTKSKYSASLVYQSLDNLHYLKRTFDLSHQQLIEKYNVFCNEVDLEKYDSLMKIISNSHSNWRINYDSAIKGLLFEKDRSHWARQTEYQAYFKLLGNFLSTLDHKQRFFFWIQNFWMGYPKKAVHEKLDSINSLCSGLYHALDTNPSIKIYIR